MVTWNLIIVFSTYNATGVSLNLYDPIVCTGAQRAGMRGTVDDADVL